MSLPPRAVQELKSMIRGDADLTWHVWWAANEEGLEQRLPRLEFLKLKFGRLDGAAELLVAAGEPVEWSPRGRRLSAWSKLHRDAVDADGRPRAELRKMAYNGALAAFGRGDESEGLANITRFVGATVRRGRQSDRGQILGELVLDAEMLAADGNRRGALLIAKEVSNLAETPDDLSPAIAHAKKLESRLEGSGGGE